MNSHTCVKIAGEESSSPAISRDLDVQHERFGRIGVDERAAGRQQPLHRPHDEVEDLADEEAADDEADDQRDDGVDDASPELVEMLQERHLPAGFFFAVELVVAIRIEVVVRHRRRRLTGKRHQGHAARLRAGAGARRAADGVVRRRRDELRGRGVDRASASAGWRRPAAIAEFCSALMAARESRCSSTRISSSSVLRSSFEAFLNSPMLRPSERPSSGSFRGPKMMSAITRMMTSSGMPMEPNIGRTPADREPARPGSERNVSKGGGIPHPTQLPSGFGSASTAWPGGAPGTPPNFAKSFSGL